VKIMVPLQLLSLPLNAHWHVFTHLASHLPYWEQHCRPAGQEARGVAAGASHFVAVTALAAGRL
jgi:hypothetical protein